MHKGAVKDIVAYYRNIPDMLKYERNEREAIEDKYYNGMKGQGNDGMPHRSGTGNPTEKMGMVAAENNASKKMEKINVKIMTLEHDHEVIEDCIGCMNSKYRVILCWHWVYEYNWSKIAIRFSKPESTVRYWMEKAIDQLGEILEKDVLMLDELVERASRAR